MSPQNKQTIGTAQVHFAVSDGRVALGTIDVIDGMFVATDINGIVIGKFTTLGEAARAIDDGGQHHG
jgi:hypothetical protein